jgi:hypothetical protein
MIPNHFLSTYPFVSEWRSAHTTHFHWRVDSFTTLHVVAQYKQYNISKPRQAFVLNGLYLFHAQKSCKTMPQLRRLDTGFSPRRPGFDPRSGNVGFIMDGMVLGLNLSEYFGFPYEFLFHQLLHILSWTPYILHTASRVVWKVVTFIMPFWPMFETVLNTCQLSPYEASRKSACSPGSQPLCKDTGCRFLLTVLNGVCTYVSACIKWSDCADNFPCYV